MKKRNETTQKVRVKPYTGAKKYGNQQNIKTFPELKIDVK